MKKIIIIFLGLALISGAVISASSKNSLSNSDNGFYCSPEKQKEIYNITLQENFTDFKYLTNEGFTVVEESIAPVYGLDMLDYASTGKINLFLKYDTWVPEYTENGINLKNKTTVETAIYTAKLINSKGEYAGNMRLHFQSNLDMPRSTVSDAWYAPFSYADHAERIKNILGYDKYVPAEYVKLVSLQLPYGGWYFYINDGKTECFINVGMLKNVQTFYNDETREDETVVSDLTDEDRQYYDKVISVDEMRERAVKYKKFVDEQQAIREKWEAEHPGEEYPLQFGSYSDNEIIPIVDGINNIVNIRSYMLENGMIKPATKISDWLIVSGTTLVTATAATVVMMRKRRKKGNE